MVVNTLILIDVNIFFDCRFVYKRWQELIDPYTFQKKKLMT
ncbi:F-box only protein 6-like [Aphis craccivora]|uniref:F-box only protein 6-like n=1 Tax=Aphis craccivora TaxID=307492 RepID=A0A6G0XZD3_APHCR|nr:F-box only protein 6-like [Aphis craccivora]